ncbi:MAG TPA: serine/threonine-protein kinase [Longimicrobium sp.]|nr:serine/threonine-protein kinase [Longimicrobium sp.]
MSDAAAPDAGLVGTVLAGRYRILGKLGEGAMGAVYLGEHLRIGRRDAIKVLRESLEGDAEALARFGRGARNVSLIQHPNVCTVYDFGDTDDGRRFLAMEFVPGETLQELLAREGRLPPARAAAIFAQVAGALQAAHEAGIVHRDLKPGNVMVSPGRGGADAVKVVDFDIAKGSRDGEPGDVTRLGFVIGTPEYMSPEQLLGMPLDGRSDVYSLALVLFRMLAGALPFRASDTQEMMVQRLTGDPLRLEDVLPGLAAPPALQAALDRALQRRAEDRFESAAAFADAVAAALAQPTSAAASATAAFASAPLDPRPEAPQDTRGGVPLTVITATDPPASPREPTTRRALPRLTPARVAGGVLAASLAVAAVWGASRAMGPPSGDETDPANGAANQAGTVDPQPADPAKAIVLAADSLRAASADSVRTTTTPISPVVDPPPTPPPAPPEPPLARTGSPRVDPPRADPPPRRDPPPAGRRGVTAANASATANRLMDRVSSGPSAQVLRAARDTARAVYALDGAPRTARATAAYVTGDALSQLGDPAGCVEWLERSLRVNESNGARILLDDCRGRLP